MSGLGLFRLRAARPVWLLVCVFYPTCPRILTSYLHVKAQRCFFFVNWTHSEQCCPPPAPRLFSFPPLFVVLYAKKRSNWPPIHPSNEPLSPWHVDNVLSHKYSMGTEHCAWSLSRSLILSFSLSQIVGSLHSPRWIWCIFRATDHKRVNGAKHLHAFLKRSKPSAPVYPTVIILKTRWG